MKKQELVSDFIKRRIWDNEANDEQKKTLNKLFMNELRLWDADASCDMFYDIDVLEGILQDLESRLEKILKHIKKYT